MSRGAGSFVFAVLISLITACGGDAGEEDSEILLPFDSLAGGVVFSSAALPGSGSYDLWWVPIPSAGNPSPQPAFAITSASGTEWQPSVSRSGNAIAFASDDGILLITSSGRITRISDTSDSPLIDSLPAVSPDGERVAWVREDTGRQVPNTDFFQATIMIANADGADEQMVSPRNNIVQDAPVFDPDPRLTRIAWSEFDPSSVVSGFGPTVYGVRVADYVLGTSDIVCSNEDDQQRTAHLPQRTDRVYRCFGQHMAWPVPNTIVLTQDFLEIQLDGTPFASVYDTVLQGIQTQQTGIPAIGLTGTGFFPAFPLSASYSGDASLMVFDGVMTFVEGDQPSLTFQLASSDGGNTRRLSAIGHTADLDTANTGSFLFSRATPQIIPFRN